MKRGGDVARGRAEREATLLVALMECETTLPRVLALLECETTSPRVLALLD